MKIFFYKTILICYKAIELLLKIDFAELKNIE